MKARKMKITIVDKGKRIYIPGIPIGLMSRLITLAGDLHRLWTRVSVKETPWRHDVNIKDLAKFFEALKTIEPFVMVEVEEGDTRVTIQTE